MRKTITAMMILFAFSFLTQCRKNVVQQSADVTDGEKINVTLNVDSGSSKTDINVNDYTVKWKVGDKLYVVGSEKGLLGELTAQNSGVSAYFTGAITAITEKQYFYFYYVGDNGFSLDETGCFTFDISQQTGKIDDIEKDLHLMSGKSENEIEAGQTDLKRITMESMISIATMKFSRNDDNAILADNITCSGGFASATINAKNGTFNTKNTADINLTNVTSDNYYIVLLPGEQTLRFSQGIVELQLEKKNVAENMFYSQKSIEMHRLGCILSGLFSIKEGTQVYFSQGNLVYDGHRANNKLYFHDNQYDRCFVDLGQNVSGYYSQDSGPFDLFGWGTGSFASVSGRYVQPWSTNSGDTYGPAGNENLNGGGPFGTNYGTYDWGHNIAPANTWFTLSSSHWEYLINSTNRTYRYYKAVVHDVRGLIIFPDNWSNSGDCYFTGYNVTGAAYTAVDDKKWAACEAAGAVFLPEVTGRNGTTTDTNGTKGFYWSCTRSGTSDEAAKQSKSLDFRRIKNGSSWDSWVKMGSSWRYRGAAVRLVCLRPAHN